MEERVIEWGVFSLLGDICVFFENCFINTCKFLIFKAVMLKNSVFYSLY